jgi:hypothetical protein
MKMLLLSISFALCSSLNAQGNLQFNRVLSQSVTSPDPFPAGQIIASVVVPEGKVWKVENASYTRILPSLPEYRLVQWASSQIPGFYLDDYLLCQYYNASGGQVINPSFPIWLNEGSYTLRLVTSATASQLRGTINVIEFNIIP